MPSYDDIFKKKIPVQPQLFEDRPDMQCDSKANDQKRLALKAQKKPTFMVVGTVDFKCFICKYTMSNPLYFRERFCLECNIFHDPEDGA